MAMKKVVNGEYEFAKSLMKSKVELIKDSQERLEAQITHIHILIYLVSTFLIHLFIYLLHNFLIIHS